MHVKLGAVDTAVADDELVHTRIADHHPGHVGGGLGAGEEGLRAPEVAGVLVDVEQQNQPSNQTVTGGGEADGYVAKMTTDPRDRSSARMTPSRQALRLASATARWSQPFGGSCTSVKPGTVLAAIIATTTSRSKGRRVALLPHPARLQQCLAEAHAA
ncbi:hypothetical protein [Kutzneria sp. NPDC052558]|uniref:hypothetical protein n=1 Tax=Kutzneria sp. NPDC052558 TaxID=3364121 RepID=UPI0037C75871